MAISAIPVVDETLTARLVLFRGAEHMKREQNRQDAFFAHLINNSGQIEIAAVGADGCSSSEFSEAGAQMVTQFAAPLLARLVKEFGLSNYDLIGRIFYGSIITWLKSIIYQMESGPQYLALLELERAGGELFLIDNHSDLKEIYHWLNRSMMWTFVTMYYGVEGTITFQRGDGGFLIDDALYHTDFKDVPPYIAYDVMPWQKVNENIRLLSFEKDFEIQIPKPGFDVGFYPNANKVAMFSDGALTASGDLLKVFDWNQVWNRLDPIHKWGQQRNRLEVLIKKPWLEGLISDDLLLFAVKRE